jgi:hypothetical protein
VTRKQRDYEAEYRRRLARGLAKGLSRSQARGHPRATEPYLSPKVPGYRKLEQGVAALRKTKSLSAAARQAKLAPERLRRYLGDLDFVEKRRGRWFVGEDKRLRTALLYTDGRELRVVVEGYEPAAMVGSYRNAVGEFLRTNDPAHLAPFVGRRVTDYSGKTYTFETRPNVLYRLDAAGGDTFEQVYKLVI